MVFPDNFIRYLAIIIHYDPSVHQSNSISRALKPLFVPWNDITVNYKIHEHSGELQLAEIILLDVTGKAFQLLTADYLFPELK